MKICKCMIIFIVCVTLFSSFVACRDEATRIEDAIQLFYDNTEYFNETAELLLDNGEIVTVYNYGEASESNELCIKVDGLYYYGLKKGFSVDNDLSEGLDELYNRHSFVAIDVINDDDGNKYVDYCYWSTMGKGISIVFTPSGKVYSGNDWYDCECVNRIDDNWYIQIERES